ncbi:Ig-like domain-containing protein [Microbacterium sp. NPDC058342]|uniref:Ig-like domain-containing protein n=1 Tax=Microbacterium sp. NPDC058342 TaxID=3346454 RepID=UPI0036570D09
MRHRRWRWLTAVTALLALTVSGLAPTAASGAADDSPWVSIDDPLEGSTLPGDTLTVSGRYHRVDRIELVVGAQQILPTDVDASAGTWSADVDLSATHGDLELVVRGRDLDTLYTTWSPAVRVQVDNRRAAVPVVSIVSPDEGSVGGKHVSVSVRVDSPTPVRRVEVAINGQHWRVAARDPHTGLYRVKINAREWLGDFAAIRARATTRAGMTGESPSTYVALGGASAQQPIATSQDRAIWIWERASYAVVFDETERDKLGAVMDDTATFDSDPIRTIYLGVDRYRDTDMLRDSRAEVARFVRWAKDRGYQVQATIAGGTRPPYFGALEQYEHFAVAEMEKVLDYNLAVPSDARFDGVNVDIEPYILPQWKEPGTTLPTRWLEVLDALIQRRDASGQPLLFGPAVPRWLDTSACCTQVTWNGTTKPLSDHVQDMTDYIAIMDYRDSADGGAGIIAQAQHEIEYAQRIGKPNSVVVGVETKDLTGGGDPETVTFYEEGRTHMEGELKKVYAAFADSPAFAGVAMHHFDSLVSLPSVWGDDAVWYPIDRSTIPKG